MTWDRRLAELFEDLEQQAAGLQLAARDAEVAELSVAEYAEVDLAGRVHASVGRPVELSLVGGGTVHGTLARAGAGWCLLVDPAGTARETLVRLPAVTAARGLSSRAVAEPARPVTARLGLGSVLRSLAGERVSVHVLGVDGGRRQGLVQRVGADFFELAGEGGAWVVPFTGVAALRA